MPVVNEWRRVPISEVYLGLFDGPHATPAPADEGPVFLGIKNITEDGRLDLSDIRHISEAEYPRWTKRIEPQPGDIVFTYEATLNRYAIIPEGFRGCLGRRTALIRPDPAKISTRFLFYYFFSTEWRGTVAQNLLIGSTVDRIPLTKFPEFPIVLPPLDVQHRIADILSAYDDLIENNTRRIAILEEMAQAIYREWFVNFRFPGHEQVGMVESELGPVPDGWDLVALADIAVQVRQNVQPSAHPDELFAHFSIPAFDESRQPALEAGATIRSTKHLVPEGAVLLSKLNPRIPRVWLPSPPLEQRSICSTEFVVLQPNDVPRSYLYELLSSSGFLGNLAARVGGTSTSHQRVKPADLLSMAVVRPEHHIMVDFSRVTHSIHSSVDALRKKNGVLRRTRDVLLPRLISGEIEVGAAEDELAVAAA